MLPDVNGHRVDVRVLTAALAVAALAVAAPLHLAHGHDDSSLSRMHAPCAACQFHQTTSTPAEPTCGVLAPPVAQCAAPTAPEALPTSVQPAPDGCRAPPFSAS